MFERLLMKTNENCWILYHFRASSSNHTLRKFTSQERATNVYKGDLEEDGKGEVNFSRPFFNISNSPPTRRSFLVPFNLFWQDDFFRLFSVVICIGMVIFNNLVIFAQTRPFSTLSNVLAGWFLSTSTWSYLPSPQRKKQKTKTNINNFNNQPGHICHPCESSMAEVDPTGRLVGKENFLFFSEIWNFQQGFYRLFIF